MTEFRACACRKALARFIHLVQEGEAQLAQIFAAASARGEIRAWTRNWRRSRFPT